MLQYYQMPHFDLLLLLMENKTQSILNIALSFLSILLILLGLFFIYLGIRDIVAQNQGLNTQTDNSSEGSVGVGISVTKSPEEVKNGNGNNDNQKLTAQEKALKTQEQIRITGKWIATNYESGDISRGDYVVKQGDTLWEIAEAVYGDGYKWTIILDRNKSSIGKLPNGEQALIFPGQVLIIE